LLTLLTFLITSCSRGVDRIETVKVEVKREPLNLEKPPVPKQEELKWIIINSENAEEVFAKLKEKGTDPVLFGLTDDEYEDLAVNFAQIRNYIIQQNFVIDKYKEYYESEETNGTD
jgi:hypothetical protein